MLAAGLRSALRHAETQPTPQIAITTQSSPAHRHINRVPISAPRPGCPVLAPPRRSTVIWASKKARRVQQIEAIVRAVLLLLDLRFQPADLGGPPPRGPDLGSCSSAAGGPTAPGWGRCVARRHGSCRAVGSRASEGWRSCRGSAGCGIGAVRDSLPSDALGPCAPAAENSSYPDGGARGDLLARCHAAGLGWAGGACPVHHAPLTAAEAVETSSGRAHSSAAPHRPPGAGLPMENGVPCFSQSRATCQHVRATRTGSSTISRAT